MFCTPQEWQWWFDHDRLHGRPFVHLFRVRPVRPHYESLCAAQSSSNRRPRWCWRRSRCRRPALGQVLVKVLRQRHLRLADRRDRRRQGARPLPAAPAGPRGDRHRAGSAAKASARSSPATRSCSTGGRERAWNRPRPSTQSKIGRVNAGWVTTFNEYAIVSENRVTAIPRDFDAEIGGPAGLRGDDRFRRDQQQCPAQDRPVDRRLRRRRHRAEHRAGGGAGLRPSDHRRRPVRQPPGPGPAPGGHAPDQLRAADAEAEIRKIVGPAGRRRGRGQHGQRQGDRDGLPPHRPPAAGRCWSACRPRKARRPSTRCRCTSKRRSPARTAASALPEHDIPNYVRLCSGGQAATWRPAWSANAIRWPRSTRPSRTSAAAPWPAGPSSASAGGLTISVCFGRF